MDESVPMQRKHKTWPQVNQYQAVAGGASQSKHELTTAHLILPRFSWVQPWLAVVLQLVVASIIAIFTFVGVWIEHNANKAWKRQISTSVRISYVTGITVMATLVSSFTAAQIASLWLRDILSASPKEAVSIQSRRKATTIFGQASLADQARTWPISITLLVTGLITTAIVAGLSMSNEDYSQRYTTRISVDYLNPYVSNQQCLSLGRNFSADEFAWQLSNGSMITVNQSQGRQCCAENTKASLLDPWLRTLEPGYAYAISGIPVHGSAAGMPVGYFNDLTSTFGAGLTQATSNHLQWSTTCGPVLSLNPVKCEVTGNVTVNQNNLTVLANNCTVSKSVYAVDPSTEGASVAGACTQGMAVGTATIVIGAVNRHAESLAYVAGDAAPQSRQSYSVACSVDISPAISFRQLRYEAINIVDYAFLSGGSSAFHVVGNSSCVPHTLNSSSSSHSSLFPQPHINRSQLLTDAVLTIGASAAWPLLVENQYADGWLNTLYTLPSPYSQSWIFNNSQTGIEDFLGVVSAFALGLFWGGVIDDGNGLEIQDGVIQFTGLRIGPGKWWVLVFVLPSLFSASVLLYLMWRLKKKEILSLEDDRLTRRTTPHRSEVDLIQMKLLNPKSSRSRSDLPYQTERF